MQLEQQSTHLAVSAITPACRAVGQDRARSPRAAPALDGYTPRQSLQRVLPGRRTRTLWSRPHGEETADDTGLSVIEEVELERQAQAHVRQHNEQQHQQRPAVAAAGNGCVAAHGSTSRGS
jgi:hypothetical protein